MSVVAIVLRVGRASASEVICGLMRSIKRHGDPSYMSEDVYCKETGTPILYGLTLRRQQMLP